MHTIINVGNIKQREQAQDLGERPGNAKLVLQRDNSLAGCEYGNEPFKTVNFFFILIIISINVQDILHH
jgi:hypothetical protein